MWKFAGVTIRKLRLSSSLNSGASIEIDLKSSGSVLERLTPGSIQSIQIGGDEVQQVRVTRATTDYEGNWIVCRPVGENSTPASPGRHRVTQCRPDDTVTKFISRAVPKNILSPPNNKVVPLSILSAAIAPGTTIFLKPGDSWDEIAGRILNCLRARAPMFVGYRKAFTAGPWNLVAFNVGAPSSYVTRIVQTAWTMASGASNNLRLENRRGNVDVRELLAQFSEEARSQFTFGDWTAPIGPTTVEYLGNRWLCVSMSATLEQSSTDKPFVLTISLTPSFQPMTAYSSTSLFRLAKFVGWNDDALVKICPVDRKEIASPALKAMCDWQVTDGNDIVAVLSSPGFVRDTHSAFYARLRPGDLLIVEFGRDGVPVALGCPQRRRVLLEQSQGAELALSANQLDLSALAESGEISSKLDILPTGTISASARQMNVRASIDVSGEDLAFSGPMKINGTVQVM